MFDFEAEDCFSAKSNFVAFNGLWSALGTARSCKQHARLHPGLGILSQHPQPHPTEEFPQRPPKTLRGLLPQTTKMFSFSTNSNFGFFKPAIAAGPQGHHSRQHSTAFHGCLDKNGQPLHRLNEHSSHTAEASPTKSGPNTIFFDENHEIPKDSWCQLQKKGVPFCTEARKWVFFFLCNEVHACPNPQPLLFHKGWTAVFRILKGQLPVQSYC